MKGSVVNSLWTLNTADACFTAAMKTYIVFTTRRIVNDCGVLDTDLNGSLVLFTINTSLSSGSLSYNKNKGESQENYTTRFQILSKRKHFRIKITFLILSTDPDRLSLKSS